MSPPRSATPSPPLSSSATDEGIVIRDLRGGAGAKHRRRHREGDRSPLVVYYKCTFPGCSALEDTVRAIESHVRAEHLHRPADEGELGEEERDHEEEFYYTEVEAEEGEKRRRIVQCVRSGVDYPCALLRLDHHISDKGEIRPHLFVRIKKSIRVLSLRKSRSLDYLKKFGAKRRRKEYYFYVVIIISSAAFSYSSSVSSPPSGHMAALSLADHLDMARPAHEAPGMRIRGGGVAVPVPVVRRQAVAVPLHHHHQQRRRVATGSAAVAPPAHQSSTAASASLLSRSLPTHGSGPAVSIAHSATVRARYIFLYRSRPFS